MYGRCKEKAQPLLTRSWTRDVACSDGSISHRSRHVAQSHWTKRGKNQPQKAWQGRDLRAEGGKPRGLTDHAESANPLLWTCDGQRWKTWPLPAIPSQKARCEAGADGDLHSAQQASRLASSSRSV
ncbi:unnamed protein product [Lepidochelys kempii]